MRSYRSGFFVLAAIVLAASSPARAEDWPGWRGPRGDGSSIEKNVPVKWDATTGDGVAWSAEIPGEGHSSPIILGKRIFVTAADTETEKRLLLCLDRDSGRELWR